MKKHFLSALSVLFFITGCTGTFEVGMEHSPAITINLPADPNATQAPVISPTPTPQPIATVLPTVAPVTQPPALLPTDTRPAPVIATQQMVKIFMIAVDDNGQSGIAVGCGDSAVPVMVEIPPTQGVLRAALAKLLSIKDQYYGQSGLYNALYQSDLQVDNVTIDGNGKASVYLAGTLKMGGECDTPRVQAQLEQTVRQFTTVTDVAILINGKLLADVLSLKG